jgi:glutamyl-tRNA synthetase
MTVRTRFAPSPTGYLHIGGARTALLAWAFARHHQGQFILRIEDTDTERSTQASVDAILESMQWLGLDFDEGPFYQTQRFDRYGEVIQQLLDTGHAYRCTCSKARLTELRESQMAAKEKPRYDGRCRDLNIAADVNEPFVIRFRNPQDGTVVFDDAVYGEITVNNSELDDLIIARSDLTPTYNLTVVVDDWDMKITHVVRGDDHINNTPRQINILKALSADIPEYAHLPMILGPDGKRLSKRHGAVGVMQYHDDGYLPEALLNYLVRLGWSYRDQEVFSRDEMIEHFTLQAVNRSAASINPDKLLWLNQHYIKEFGAEEIARRLKPYLDVDLNKGPALTDVVACLLERAKTLVELAEAAAIFYQDEITYDEKATAKHLKPELAEPLQALTAGFSALEDWHADALNQVIHQVAEQFELKMGKVAQPLRVAVTGNTVSPPIAATLQLMGRETVLGRLEGVMAKFV